MHAHAPYYLTYAVGFLLVLGAWWTVIPRIPGLWWMTGVMTFWAVVIPERATAAALVCTVVIMTVAAGLKRRFATSTPVSKTASDIAVLAGLGGIAGVFVVPLVGFPLGFGATLALAARHRCASWKDARPLMKSVIGSIVRERAVDMVGAVLILTTWQSASWSLYGIPLIG